MGTLTPTGPRERHDALPSGGASCCAGTVEQRIHCGPCESYETRRSRCQECVWAMHSSDCTNPNPNHRFVDADECYLDDMGALAVRSWPTCPACGTSAFDDHADDCELAPDSPCVHAVPMNECAVCAT